ncbi:Transcriptional regulator, AraC family protein [Minicystis rosea]|nr:Transcriptional regulator, AraC family protein [Minicystis rosea]
MTTRRQEPDAGTVSTALLRCFAISSAAMGFDAARLLEDLGVATVIEKPDLRISAAVAAHAFEEAALRAGDPDFGLHAAERLPPGAVGLIDYHTRSSPTIGEAIRRMACYFSIIHDRTSISLEPAHGRARIVRTTQGAALPRQLAEFLLAMIVLRGRALSGRPWPGCVIELSHPAPADKREHRRVFGVEPRFERPSDALSFDEAFLDQPLATADPELSSVLARHADAIVSKLPKAAPTLLDDVRRAIADILCHGDPSVDATAARLGTSRRTLQRKLRAHGTSHAELVDDVRRELALRQLEGSMMTINEIADLLGFSEPAAFHRAFKRWTSTTPAEHRRALGAPAQIRKA